MLRPYRTTATPHLLQSVPKNLATSARHDREAAMAASLRDLRSAVSFAPGTRAERRSAGDQVFPCALRTKPLGECAHHVEREEGCVLNHVEEALLVHRG